MVDQPSGLIFPDGPRSELDRVIAQLVDNAQQVLTTQGRLRSLLDASRSVADELELPVVLRKIIEAAVGLVGAKYGAIGVIAPDGSLEQFIHVGMPDELVAHIGHLPEGHGLLGALIDEQVPIRLDHLHDDPRSSGFPQGHPPMESFLGVPVRVRDEVYGNLYLSEALSGTFTEEDQQLVVALAGTAGAAIDHARLFDESRRRQRWSAASAEVMSALLADQIEDSLAILADRMAQLADADLVCVVLPAGPEMMLIEVARGDLADRFQGTTFASAGTLAGRVYESGNPVLSDLEVASGEDPLLAVGAMMALPLSSSDERTGVLTVSRLPGGPRFTSADLDMAADFAAQASVALRLASGRGDRQRIAVLEDRGRIARDLHDHVIQRLFGAGLSLQAIAGSLPDAAAQARLLDQVAALDSAIVEIRTAIFTMTTQSDGARASVRHRIIDLLSETNELFTESPRLSFLGPVDLMVPQEMADDVVAVVREGLTNVARHAAAEHTTVSVAVADGDLAITIEDDGDGIDPDRQGVSSGTANLASRAELRGGRFELAANRPKGTVLTWTVPLGSRGEQR
ncbi:two-component system sensor histidine kinase [soil metagenome]